MGRSEDKRRKRKKRNKAAEREEDELLDPSKPIRPLGTMMRERETMLDAALEAVQGRQLRRLIPPELADLSPEDLRTAALQQLEVMSKKRLRCVLGGREMSASSGTEESSDPEEEDEEPAPSPTKPVLESAEADSTTADPVTDDLLDQDNVYPGEDIDLGDDVQGPEDPEGSAPLSSSPSPEPSPQPQFPSSSGSDSDDEDDDEDEEGSHQPGPSGTAPTPTLQPQSDTGEEMEKKQAMEEDKEQEALAGNLDDEEVVEEADYDMDTALEAFAAEEEDPKAALPPPQMPADEEEDVVVGVERERVLDLAPLADADDVDSEEEDERRLALAKAADSKLILQPEAEVEEKGPPSPGRLPADDPRLYPAGSTTEDGHVQRLRYERYTIRRELERPAFNPKLTRHEAKTLAARPGPDRPQPLPPGPEKLSYQEVGAQPPQEAPPVEEEPEPLSVWPPKEPPLHKRHRKVDSLDRLLSMATEQGMVVAEDDEEAEIQEETAEESEEKAEKPTESSQVEEENVGKNELDAELVGLKGVPVEVVDPDTLVEEGPAPRPPDFKSRSPTPLSEPEEGELGDEEDVAGPDDPLRRRAKHRTRKAQPLPSSSQLAKWEELEPLPLPGPKPQLPDSGNPDPAAEEKEMSGERSGGSSPMEADLRPEDDALFGLEEAQRPSDTTDAPTSVAKLRLEELVAAETSVEGTGAAKSGGVPTSAAQPRAPPGIQATTSLKEPQPGSSKNLERYDSDESSSLDSGSEGGDEEGDDELAAPGLEPRSKRSIPGLPLIPRKKEAKKTSIVPVKTLFAQLKKEKEEKKKRKETALVMGPETRGGLGLQGELGREAPVVAEARRPAEGPSLPQPDWQGEEDAAKATHQSKTKPPKVRVELTPEMLAEQERKRVAHEAEMAAKKAKLEGLISAKEQVLKREREAKRRLEEQERRKAAALKNLKKGMPSAREFLNQERKELVKSRTKSRQDSDSGSSLSSSDEGSVSSSVSSSSASSSGSSSSSTASVPRKIRKKGRGHKKRASSSSSEEDVTDGGVRNKGQGGRRTPSPQSRRGGPELFPGGPAPLTPSKRRDQHGFAGWGPSSVPVDYRSRGSFRQRGVGREAPHYPPESHQSGAFRDAFGIQRGIERPERAYGRDRHERERGFGRRYPDRGGRGGMGGGQSRVMAGEYNVRQRQRDWSAWDDDRYQDDREAEDLSWTGSVAKMDVEPEPQRVDLASKETQKRRRREEKKKARKDAKKEARRKEKEARRAAKKARAGVLAEEVRGGDERRVLAPPTSAKPRKVQLPESSTSKRQVQAPKGGEGKTKGKTSVEGAGEEEEGLELHELELRARAIKALMVKHKL